MEKYDLELALERLNIPDEMCGKIVVFNTPFVYGFSTPFKWNQTIVLFTNGEIAKTDFVLLHELKHREQIYKGRFKLFSEQNITESEAVESSLSSLLTLIKKYPSIGYEQLFNEQYDKIKEFQLNGGSNIFDKKLGNRYYAKVNLNRL